MKKSALLPLLALLFFPALSPADEAVRSAQDALRQNGYYTGESTGNLDDATRAAIRRYQLRSGLEVSGDLTAETAAALNGNTGGQTAQPAPPPAAPSPAAPQPAAPVAPIAPVAPAVPPAPPVVPSAPPVDPAFAALFAHTPFEFAPQEVQSETVRKAQVQLSERRLYLDRVDGRPGPAMEAALYRYQAKLGLPPTGRLDIDTLAAMRLLPVAKIKRPRVEPRPYVPQTPAGAVRGVPLD